MNAIPQTTALPGRSESAQPRSTLDRERRQGGLLRRLGGLVWTAVAVAAVMLATLAVVIAIASHLSRPGQYTVFGHPVLTVMSGSMSPTIRTGDLVYDEQLSTPAAEHLHAGQIITFHTNPGSYETITHRIHAVVKIDGTVAYQTKGDENLTPDRPLVAPGDVVGLYRGRIPYGGYILNSLHHPLSLTLLLAAPFLWVLSGWFFGLAREAEREDREPSHAGGPDEAPM